MSDKDKLEPLPDLKPDEEAGCFLEDADLSKYDLSEFKPARLEFEKRSARVNMRLPGPLLDGVKAQAKARGISCQRFIGKSLEQALGNLHS